MEILDNTIRKKKKNGNFWVVYRCFTLKNNRVIHSQSSPNGLCGISTKLAEIRQKFKERNLRNGLNRSIPTETAYKVTKQERILYFLTKNLNYEN